ncbi:hypothetical protein FRB94_012058 [Tulasnella sp. JGI-2019a]|nr:hypothetical protein FRB94_012058 [Tulasnella sp. JGI-2019a]KAG9014542.1 hypothetical protein FRB93_013667 [Tulasnella sp. JGI-2019a]
MPSIVGSIAAGRLQIDHTAANRTPVSPNVPRVYLPAGPHERLGEGIDIKFTPFAVGWEATIPLKDLHSILARDKVNHHPVTIISSSTKLLATSKVKGKTSAAKERGGSGAGAKGAGATQTAVPTMTPTSTGSEINWQELVEASSATRSHPDSRFSSYPRLPHHIHYHSVTSSAGRLGPASAKNLYMPTYKPGSGWTSRFEEYESTLPQRQGASGSGSNRVGNSHLVHSRNRDRRPSLIGPSESAKRATGNGARYEPQMQLEEEANTSGGGRYPTRTRKTTAQAMDVEDEDQELEPVVAQKKAPTGTRKVAKSAKLNNATKTAATLKGGKQVPSPSPVPSATATSGKRKRAQAPKALVQGPEDEQGSEEDGGRTTRASKRRKVIEAPVTTTASAVQMPPPATIPSKLGDAPGGSEGVGEATAPALKTRNSRSRITGIEQTAEKPPTVRSTRSSRAANRGQGGASPSPSQSESREGAVEVQTPQEMQPAYSTRRRNRTSGGSADSDKNGKIRTSPSVRSDETAVDRQAEQPKKIGFEVDQLAISAPVGIPV